MSRILEVLIVAGMAAMSAMVFLNVVLRYAFSSGIPFSVEISRLIFVWLIFLGTILALKDGAHLCVDTLVRRLPRVPKFLCYWASHLLMLWCCWLLWEGSWIQTAINWSNAAPISGISVGVMYAAGLVAAAAMGVTLIGNLWRSFADFAGGRGSPADAADEEGERP
ncbi:TRAP transporter small permease [Aquabacter spiritensis]|uniref:TRAP transporter small permease n=1 Tax=Aquabacter spiritensis TaxID=933073 RepID=UPI0014053C42|nr:TRAP transporter small permease [Aquabacter spiritensis]